MCYFMWSVNKMNVNEHHATICNSLLRQSAEIIKKIVKEEVARARGCFCTPLEKTIDTVGGLMA